MKIKLLNQKGKEVEDKLTLDKGVWTVARNDDLVAQVLYVFNSNQRRGTAHAKTRGDVSGGGRKPWKQKGTGRARAGSTRSPIWVKGGVAFPPNDRNWARKINEKMKKKAISSILSVKLKDENIKFVKFGKKTELKDMREDIMKLSEGLKTLVVSENLDVLNSVRNVEKVLISRPLNMNVYNVLNNVNILIDAESVSVIEGRFKNDK